MSSPGAMHDDQRLRRLETITDPALSRLSASDLLDELLNRVRTVLAVDTAAVMLLDPYTRQLVATASQGLAEEVRQAFRLELGRGFAGRVAHTGRPQVIGELTPAEVVNPLLLSKGIRSMLGVPIFAAGEVIGVLHVGTLTPRSFTSDDISLLQHAADRAGAAGQLRFREPEQTAALALQHSLLPPQLADIDGLQMAARYVPGHTLGVGGDWYDVFRLPSGSIGMVIGDVSGHGLASAVVMGRIRSALRAYALNTDDPAVALALLDRKIQHFEAGALTTALYAVISPDRRSVRISSAGHLRPVIALPGQPAALLDLPVDAPLGVGRYRSRRRATTVGLPVGALLLGYTDGLVERRHQIIDVGIKALIDVVTSGNPEAVCATVMSHLGSDQPQDDIAVLAIRRHTATHTRAP